MYRYTHILIYIYTYLHIHLPLSILFFRSSIPLSPSLPLLLCLTHTHPNTHPPTHTPTRRGDRQDGCAMFWRQSKLRLEASTPLHFDMSPLFDRPNVAQILEFEVECTFMYVYMCIHLYMYVFFQIYLVHTYILIHIYINEYIYIISTIF